jgi:hypothetical protein
VAGTATVDVGHPVLGTRRVTLRLDDTAPDTW